MTATRILLIGGPGPELRIAAGMARECGAAVRLATSQDDALSALRHDGADLVMIDVETDVAGFISRLRAERFAVPVLGCGVNASASRAVAAIRAGAYDYLPLPPQRDLIAAALQSIGERAVELIGEDPAFIAARDRAIAFARTPLPLLLTGPPGSGKALLARAVHAASGAIGQLVIGECRGVAPAVLSSELFGHAAGDFPGAVSPRLGKLTEAAGGTLVLRSIDTLPTDLQARLLDALDAGTTRLIATTADASAGKLRADLAARLATARVTFPALAARGADIDRLAAAFATRLSRLNGLVRRTLSPDALAAARAYPWPGNVGELEDVIHRAVLFAEGPTIGPAHLLRSDGSPLEPKSAEPPPPVSLSGHVGRRMEDVERDLILSTLTRCCGNRTSASSILGISIRTMRNKLKLFHEAGFPVAPAL